MFICQLGMHNNVQGHRNANVCKQTYDASYTTLFLYDREDVSGGHYANHKAHAKI